MIVSIIILVLLIIAVYRKARDAEVPQAAPQAIAIAIFVVVAMLTKQTMDTKVAVFLIKIVFGVGAYFAAGKYIKAKAPQVKSEEKEKAEGEQ